MRSAASKSSTLLVAVGLLASCRPEAPSIHAPTATSTASAAPAATTLPDFGAIPQINLIDQDGAPFTNARMAGRAWIADFIFTTCHMACPILSARMGLVQKQLAGKPLNVQLASFSILPETDTPPVMKEYGERYHRDPTRWTFITGKPDALLTTVSAGLVRAAADNPKLEDTKTSNFISLHGELFVLIDPAGQIRGYYRKDDADLERLVADALKLGRGGV